jgi:hypothetical protein
MADRLLVVERDCSSEWNDEQFRLIELHERDKYPCYAGDCQYMVLPMEPRGLVPEDHPCFLAQVGDRWQFDMEGGQTPVYEFKGVFRVVRKFGSSRKVLIERLQGATRSEIAGSAH